MKTFSKDGFVTTDEAEIRANYEMIIRRRKDCPPHAAINMYHENQQNVLLGTLSTRT